MKNVKEIMPLYSMVMVQVYDENPYEVTTTESGLKLTTDLRENEDSGNLEKADFYVKAAKVIEVGGNCKFVRPDDDVLIDVRAVRPIRFKGHIYLNVAEENIVAVIAEGLTERFKDLKK